MKKLTIALMVSLFSITAWSATLITCDGMTNSNRTLLLAIQNEKLLQVRVQTEGSGTRAFAVNQISTNENSSFYTMLGTTNIVEIQNTVLRLDGGWLNIGHEKFACDSN